MNKFEQDKLFIRAYLTGRGMHTALRAVNLGAAWHPGVRKDGVTPEFSHQLAQIQMVRTLQGVDDLESVIAIAALHDLPEDHKYDIRWVKAEFGEVIGRGVEKMSKFFFETESDQSLERYYYDLARDSNASICKGVDVWHNQSTMVGVFTYEKLVRFIDRSESYVLPMLKEARKLFPTQEASYSHLRTRIKEQIHIIRASMEFADKLVAHGPDSISIAPPPAPEHPTYRWPHTQER